MPYDYSFGTKQLIRNLNDLNNIYQHRINLAVEYINKNLANNIKLDDIAKSAHFSPYHFHRIFMAVLKETVNDFTNRVKLEKAVKLLKYSDNPFPYISTECGFSSPSTFSRAFKNYFKISPTEFKKNGFDKNSKICKEAHLTNTYLAPINKEQFETEIIEMEEKKVAYIRINNSFQEGKVLNKFEKLVKWSKKMGIYKTETFFGMSLDDIMVTPKEKYRYEACVTIPKGFIVNDSEISTMTIPKSKYVTTTISGNIELVINAWNYLFNGWLINSEYEPEHLHSIEFFLDKKNICNWNHFDLQLCVPIKPIQKY